MGEEEEAICQRSGQEKHRGLREHGVVREYGREGCIVNE